MVVPGSAPVIQQDPALEPDLGRSSAENSAVGHDAGPAAEQVGPELEEVRKLQELVRRLEVQNQQLRTRSHRSVSSAQSQEDPGVGNQHAELNTMEINNSINSITEKQELQLMADLQSQLSKMRSEAKENNGCLRTEADTKARCSFFDNASDPKHGISPEVQNDGVAIDGFSLSDRGSGTECVEDLIAADIDLMVKMTEQHSGAGRDDLGDLFIDTALDEVEVLELGNCSDGDEDSWLYVSPKRKPTMDQKTESPLKWCRQVLDHPSPETEAACRTLINRLDQGYLSIHSALSSQSSVDSELSTSDDSISMGYKLQDLTDVQVMARLQEESLRQDCASSSASVSRRSSSASLHSLRKGTYSDQEFDTYSLEDEDDYDCSLSYRSTHRYSPSPLSSPRCQSPSAGGDYGRATPSRIRPPRRSVQSPMQDRMKYTNHEDELRHSMPNLARTSLRSLESVRSSRSLESDLQGPNSRLSRIQQPSSGLAPGKLRFASNAGQSPLTVRQSMKTGSSTNSLLTPRQPVKASSYVNPAGGVRKPPATFNPASSASNFSTTRNSSAATAAKNSPAKMRPTVGGAAASKSKLTQPSRRSLQSVKTNSLPADDSWKDGCY
ncbi:SLAIN motif-containing protein-like isoform X2 [Tachyglossus aculeatus]|uniref:SLAIN motif-containing protein-like isoform X2 n=1 Tax=Tachyglossus aculeatus TaxID=9261 RepID=UPI0018F56BE4|nr:SLAIN motif-containing protein-like isoform X2 [Tachyglossus aculeatus]